MKISKHYITIILFMFILVSNGVVQSQWSACSAVTGLGTYPVISVPSPNVVWVAGGVTSSAKIMRSVNGGYNFTVVTSNLAGTTYLSAIWAMDSMKAFVGDAGDPFGTGGNAKIWKTTNGGANWEFVTATGDASGYINSITFSRTQPETGFIQSDPPNGPGDAYWIAKTTNGGDNWALLFPPGIPPIGTSGPGFAAIDSLMFGFGLNGYSPSGIIWTKNGGANWINTTLTGLSGSCVTGFAVKSDKSVMIAATGYGSGSLPNISRSSDSGTTWNVLNTGAGVSGTCTMKWVYGTNVCYLSSTSGSQGCIKKSYDNGATWYQQTTGGVININAIDVVTEGSVIYGYGVSFSGVCIKIVDNVNRINHYSSQIPRAMKLEQNFPNPFNPVTKLRFDINASAMGEAANVKLVICDGLGRIAAELVNEPLKPGSYEVSWDAEKFSSGVYFYTLSIDSYSETKRMVLLK